MTHDQVEAMTLANRIVVLSPLKGEAATNLEQFGTPRALPQPGQQVRGGLHRLPKMNFLAGELVEIGEQECVVKLTSGDTVRARVDARRGAVGDKGGAGHSPEHLVPLGHAHADSRVSGVVQVAEHLGAESFVYMDVDGHDFTVKASSDIDVATGQEYSVGIPAEACYLFDAKEQAFRARPNISAPERARVPGFPFYTFTPFAGRKTGFFIARHLKPGFRPAGAAGRNPSLPVLV